MKSRLHALLGAIALLCIGAFWISTVASELFMNEQAVASVKNGILAAMWLMIPAMAATGASGFALGRGRGGRLIEAKQRRMKFIAANGLLVLLPAAFFLASRASDGRMDAVFYAVQILELAAGALNFMLLALNFRDGMKLAGRRSPGALPGA